MSYVMVIHSPPGLAAPIRYALSMAANDIDALYQLPLGEFTKARQELAKKSGSGGTAIKTLEKPSIPAWGVNQLYWRDRRTYEKLLRTSERVRAAHQQALRAKTGKKFDLVALED